MDFFRMLRLGIILLCVMGNCAASPVAQPLHEKKDILFQDEVKLTHDIEATLAQIKKKSPNVHEDSLRVWKNFKAGKADPHYTYRFWGRDIVLILQNEKGYTFDNDLKIAQVFGILLNKKLISKDAAHVLSVNVWGQLSYLQGRANPHEPEMSPSSKDVESEKQGVSKIPVSDLSRAA